MSCKDGSLWTLVPRQGGCVFFSKRSEAAAPRPKRAEAGRAGGSGNGGGGGGGGKGGGEGGGGGDNGVQQEIRPLQTRFPGAAPSNETGPTNNRRNGENARSGRGEGPDQRWGPGVRVLNPLTSTSCAVGGQWVATSAGGGGRGGGSEGRCRRPQGLVASRWVRVGGPRAAGAARGSPWALIKDPGEKQVAQLAIAQPRVDVQTAQRTTAGRRRDRHDRIHPRTPKVEHVDQVRSADNVRGTSASEIIAASEKKKKG